MVRIFLKSLLASILKWWVKLKYWAGKKAYEDACERKVSGKMLNRLFKKAFRRQNGQDPTPEYQKDRLIR